MSETLNFAEHTLQEIAIAWLIIVYSLRVRWLLKFKAGRERQAPTGAADTNPRKGMFYSWGIIFMPWAMESTRSKLIFYLQFGLFHIGVTLSILLSFLIPYAPDLLHAHALVIPVFQVSIGAAFIIGFGRIIRRVASKYMRAISSPDDYFSLLLLTVWFGFAFYAVPNRIDQGEGILLTYFYLTAFFLMYVPFSKISHYLYYPFTRMFFGKSMGHRGTYPMRRVTRQEGV